VDDVVKHGRLHLPPHSRWFDATRDLINADRVEIDAPEGLRAAQFRP
jgi:hypothetical protein